MFQYVLHPNAQQEYEDSIEWYLRRSPQAANNFVIATDNAIEAICTNPFQYRNRFKDFYELGVKKFSFNIIYLIDVKKEMIVITSVFHHKRNPKKRYGKQVI